MKSKILLGLKYLIILITVFAESASGFCPSSEIRSAVLTLHPSSRNLRIENRKVVARMPQNEDLFPLLFIKYESLNLLLYDPKAMQLICFNPKRTKLVPKRNPLKSKINLCLFREEAASSALRSYVNNLGGKQANLTMCHHHKRKKTCRSSFLISDCKDGKRRFCSEVKNVRKNRGVIHDLKTKYCEKT